MCDCHPLTPEQREAIRATEHEPNTREDWADLHDVIESYRRRRAARHVKAHLAEPPDERRTAGDVGRLQPRRLWPLSSFGSC